MLRNWDSFFAEEIESSICLKNYGFLEAEQKKDEFKSLFSSSKQWLTDAKVTPQMIQVAQLLLEAQIKQHESQNLEFKRIFVRDAERAFVTNANRETMMHISTIMEKKMGDYHQGMGLICAFLLLFLSPAETLALLDVSATNTKYLPNFWKAESVACATDGYLFMDMVTERIPDVAAHLSANFILPETFVQKWFCALCVHVLPFSALFPFFSNFFSQGHTYLFSFGLTLVTQFRQEILAARAQAKIYEFLRLEMHNPHVTFESIATLVDTENSSENDVSDLDFTSLRTAAYNKHLRARMERAKEAHAEDNKDEEETFQCQFCAETADYWCRDCKVYICDNCRDLDPGEHVEETHYVVDAEDKDNPDI